MDSIASFIPGQFPSCAKGRCAGVAETRSGWRICDTVWAFCSWTLSAPLVGSRTSAPDVTLIVGPDTLPPPDPGPKTPEIKPQIDRADRRTTNRNHPIGQIRIYHRIDAVQQKTPMVRVQPGPALEILLGQRQWTRPRPHLDHNPPDQRKQMYGAPERPSPRPERPEDHKPKPGQMNHKNQRNQHSHGQPSYPSDETALRRFRAGLDRYRGAAARARSYGCGGRGSKGRQTY